MSKRVNPTHRVMMNGTIYLSSPNIKQTFNLRHVVYLILINLTLPLDIHLYDRCWGLVLKCYESRTRQHKMLNVKALRPSGPYFPSDIMNLGRRL
jgi:hypothetical protein